MSVMDTQFLNVNELQVVLDMLKSFNATFQDSDIAPMNPLVLTDYNGEVIGSIDFHEGEYVFRYPADTIRGDN